MTFLGHFIRRLRNTSVRALIRALERDGFTYRRTRGSSSIQTVDALSSTIIRPEIRFRWERFAVFSVELVGMKKTYRD